MIKIIESVTMDQSTYPKYSGYEYEEDKLSEDDINEHKMTLSPTGSAPEIFIPTSSSTLLKFSGEPKKFTDPISGKDLLKLDSSSSEDISPRVTPKLFLSK